MKLTIFLGSLVTNPSRLVKGMMVINTGISVILMVIILVSMLNVYVYSQEGTCNKVWCPEYGNPHMWGVIWLLYPSLQVHSRLSPYVMVEGLHIATFHLTAI